MNCIDSIYKFVCICSCRLSYAVYMIEALLKRQDSVDMYIMYDIACMFHKHLEVIFIAIS